MEGKVCMCTSFVLCKVREAKVDCSLVPRNDEKRVS